MAYAIEEGHPIGACTEQVGDNGGQQRYER